jgi:lipopolysaccharide biosynthesis regulator YciM
MPTESAFLLAGLLFIAAALGYVFAKYGDREAEDLPEKSRGPDYLRGINFLLDEESDRALEVFTRLAEVEGDVLETHFALGNLFRKRGETDRAIRVHQNIMARPGLGKNDRAQAEFALAEDYMSAGLLDRAENLYLELRKYPEFRARALGRLMRIFEQSREWEQAIEVHAELEKLGKHDGVPMGHIAHYYCELAEQARVSRDYPAARAMLKKADACRPRSVRAILVRADLARDAGQWREAVRLYKKVADDSPYLLREVVPRLAAGSREQDDTRNFGRFLAKAMERGEEAVAAIAMAVVADDEIQEEAGFDAVQQFIRSDAALAELVDIERIGREEPDQRRAEINRVRKVLRRLISNSAAYRCSNCGYASLMLHWQCPSCRQWEQSRPENRILLTSSL